VSLALQNQIRAAFPREIAAIAQRSRSRIHDPRAAGLTPRGFEKWERIARGEEAQHVANEVRARNPRWRRDSTLDQWVERVYCAGFGMADAGAIAARPLGVTDALSGTSTIVGSLQGELGVTTATGVSAWASQLGGTTLDVTQGTGANQPLLTTLDATIWARSTVTSDGSNDVLNSAWNPPAPGTTPSWIRCVAKRISQLADSMYAGTSTSTLRFAGNGAAQTALATNGTTSTSVALTTGTWYRTECLFANSAAADYLKIGANTTGTGTAFGNGDPASWRLFASTSAAANPGNYAMQKVLVLNAAPSSLQKAILDEVDRRYYNGNISL
jgi:hypothetical protein